MYKHYKIIFLTIVIISWIFPQNYRGAEYRSIDSYLYGRFEVKLKSAAGEGLVSSFFTYNDLNPSTPWNEIDIEILGRYTNILDFVTITSGQNIHKHNHFIQFNPSLDFHVYTIEWTPDYIAWFIDGQLAFTQESYYAQLLTEPQKIMMNIWNPVFQDWVGEWNENILPRFAIYDYVSYASYAPGSGDIGTDNNFSSEWIDHFNAFDSTRWQKSDNHKWGGNQALMVKENVNFNDGKMILGLTFPEEVGLVDLSPPSVLWARSDSNKVIIRLSEEIEPTLANDPTNYLISGHNDFAAYLREDNRTVELISSSFIGNVPNLVVIRSIQDLWHIPNVASNVVTNVFKNTPLDLPIKINVGGDSYDDYLGDEIWFYESEYGHQDGSNTSTTEIISNTDNDYVYQSSISRLVKYRVRIPNGKYRLTLNFSENYYLNSGDRVFDIYIEGDKLINGLDILQSSGSPNTALDLVLDNIYVQDRILDIFFSPQIFGDGTYENRGATLSGIMIESIDDLSIFNEQSIPNKLFSLHQNFPNPFNSSTIINYNLYEKCNIALKIFDNLGKEVSSVNLQEQNPGYYHIPLTESLSSGIYIYRLEAQNESHSYTESYKMLNIK